LQFKLQSISRARGIVQIEGQICNSFSPDSGGRPVRAFLWTIAGISRRQGGRTAPGGTPGEDARATLSTALSRLALAPPILHFAFCILPLSSSLPMMHPVIYG
jgi:hypothetical protein